MSKLEKILIAVHSIAALGTLLVLGFTTDDLWVSNTGLGITYIVLCLVHHMLSVFTAFDEEEDMKIHISFMLLLLFVGFGILMYGYTKYDDSSFAGAIIILLLGNPILFFLCCSPIFLLLSTWGKSPEKEVAKEEEHSS